MIADSPYQPEDSVLTLAVGAAAGALAASVMVGLVGLERSVGPALADVGRVVLPDAWIHPAWRGSLLGLAVQLVVGAALGVLYASSQRHAPPAPLLATGAVYGVMIWVGARVLTLFGLSGLREIIHSWLWFAACLVYGVTLALAAILSLRFRPAASTVALKD